MPLCVRHRAGGRASLGLVCLQADSPEDMHSWIRAITGAVQALKTRPRVGHVLSVSYLVSNGDCANVQDVYLVDCLTSLTLLCPCRRCPL